MPGPNTQLHGRNHRYGGSDPIPTRSDYDAIVDATAGRMLDFHFDEASGSTFDSIIGLELQPFIVGAFAPIYGQPGALLDDPNDYAIALPAADTPSGSPSGAYFRGSISGTQADVGSAITVEAFVRIGRDPVGLAAIANRGWTLRIRAGLGIQWNVTPTDELITADGAVETGEWSYIVATYEDVVDGQLRVYVNGALVGVQDVAGGGPVDEGPYVNVGYDDTVLTDYHLDGEISRLIVWNAALSAEEVRRRAIAANIGGTSGVEWEDVGDGGDGGGVESPNVAQEIFDANGTWTKPDGAIAVEVVCIGAGGGGAGGARTNAASAVPGGGGGGGGAVTRALFSADDLPGTVAVTVGAGGTGGAGGTAGATIPGTDGGLSSFGDYLRAGGGGRAPATAGAGAGGALSSASSGTAGTPAGSATGGIAIQGVPGAGAAVAGSSSESGGASGGGGGSGGTGIGGAGGGSIYGGPGGGGGGAVLTGGTQAVGGLGGGTQRYGTAGLASNGGAAGTAVAPNASPGLTFAGPFCGSGGGGGAAFGIAGTGGGAGGNGGIGAGGGGGGASNDDVPAPINAGGPGGAGGNGRVIVVAYLEPV